MTSMERVLLVALAIQWAYVWTLTVLHHRRLRAIDQLDAMVRKMADERNRDAKLWSQAADEAQVLIALSNKSRTGQRIVA